MIIIHEGVPGSGKTYDAVRKIIDALKSGRTVYHNIRGLDLEMCQESISALCGLTRFEIQSRLNMLTDDQVREFWKIAPDGSFVVIDEAQLYFNSRDFAKGNNREFGDWASTHRHRGFDLLLISQRSERIETSVRSLCEFRYRYRKLNVFGSLMKKGYLVYSFAGEDRQHLAIRKMTYDVKIFRCYQSYEGDNTEKKVFKNPNLFKHPIFYLLGVSLIGCLYFFSQSSFSRGEIFDVSGGGKKKSSAAAKNLGLSQTESMDGNPIEFKTPPVLTADGTVRATPGLQAGVESVWIPLDIWMAFKQKIYCSSRGYRLTRWLEIDHKHMMALVRVVDLPPGYLLDDPVREQVENKAVMVADAPVDPSDIDSRSVIIPNPAFPQSGFR